MSGNQDAKTIGAIIIAIGIMALLIGFGMSATSTHTSRTCVNDPTGYGQNCYTGSVTTANPLRGPVLGTGIFAIIGGVGVYFLAGEGNSTRKSKRNSNNRGSKTAKQNEWNSSSDETQSGETFADELRDRKK